MPHVRVSGEDKKILKHQAGHYKDAFIYTEVWTADILHKYWGLLMVDSSVSMAISVWKDQNESEATELVTVIKCFTF